MSRMIEKLEECAAIGIPNIWLFDPRLHQMFAFHDNVLQLVEAVIATTGHPHIELTRDEVFPVLS
jgi:Uma2 family endonuclease